MLAEGGGGGSAASVDVAVVVPTYCRPHLLERLVAGLEGQTLPADQFEVVIVDNNSPDDTSERIAALAEASPLRVRQLVECERGPAATRNAGWRTTSTDVVAFIDDDCVPEPEWLAAGLQAMHADARLGVVQGCTKKPAASRTGDWSLSREIVAPTPFFEACNIFYRRGALDDTGGFDQDIAYYGEDTSLGWAVMEAGWSRGFAAGAVAYHDIEERGVRYHLRVGLLERNAARLAKRFPGFRREACWRPWAFRRENAMFALAFVGLVLATRKPVAIVLALPYARMRLPGPDHPRRARFMVERMLVDAARVTGTTLGSLRYRTFVL